MTEFDAQPGRKRPPQPELSAAQREADDVDLRAGLSGVATIVAGVRDVGDILRDVAEFAVRAIPGADGAGVTLVAPGDTAPRVAARAVTADFVSEIDIVQYEDLNEGPCLTCVASRRPSTSGSLGSDRRWPRFGGRVARMGVHSVLALPLMIDDTLIGAINSYARTRDAFAEHAVALGSQFAGAAAVSVYHAQLLAEVQQRTQRLQRALDSRAVIDQAIGIIRSRSGGTTDEASDRLTRISQSENTKLHLVAERLVEEAVRRARARGR